MSKALMEKAFEKWAEKHKTGVESKRDEVTAKTAFIAGATWQREQLEAEILNKEKSWYAEFPDEKSAQDVFNIIKDLQTKLDEAVEIIKRIKENVIQYAVTEEEQHLAYKIEQFLSSLDKTIKEEEEI